MFVQHIKMLNLTTHERRLVAKNRDIKYCKNMSGEKLLSTLDELELNFKTLSEKGLEQIAKRRRIKSYKKCRKES